MDIVPESEDVHLPQGDEDISIADFVQDSSSEMSQSIESLPCSTDIQDKLPTVDLAQESEDTHLPQSDDGDVNIADFVHERSSGEVHVLSIDFLPGLDTHLPQGDEDVNSKQYRFCSGEFLRNILPCSTDLHDKFPETDMAPESHFSQGGEDADVTDTDYPPHSSSEVSINFLPSSTYLQDKLPKVDTEVAHLPQSDEKVKIADFVHSSSGMLSEISSINVLPCSTDFKSKLSKAQSLISHSVVKTSASQILF